VLDETGQQIALETWPELAEIRGGKLSGIPDDKLREAFTGAFEGVVPEQRRFLGGESVGELMDRVHPTIARLLADETWDTVLLVLHGGVNRAILSYALTGGQRLFLGNMSQAAGCINALDVGSEPHDWILRFSNFSPPAPLQTDTRSTTMEQLFKEYAKSRLPSRP
jgi:probable phosphoglycerate mutase